MTALLWAPSRPGRGAALALAALAILATLAVERYQVVTRSPDYDDHVRAARITARAMARARALRLERGLAIDASTDPAGTGLIGSASTPITSGSAALSDKRAMLDPNLAARAVRWLRAAGIGPGDRVAVALTGSFPGLNLAAFAALTVVGADPIVISAPVSTEWGANQLGLTWLDIESAAAADGSWTYRTNAGSLAGLDSRGAEVSSIGRSMISNLLERHGIDAIAAMNPSDEVRARLAIYDRAAGGAPIGAYFIVGADSVELGGSDPSRPLTTDVNRPGGSTMTGTEPTVPSSFMARGTPVIYFGPPTELIQRFRLSGERAASIGEGPIYETRQRSLGLILILLSALFGALSLLSITSEAARSRQLDPAAPDAPEPPGDLD